MASMAPNSGGTSLITPVPREPEEQAEVRLEVVNTDAFEEALGSSEQARADLHVQTVCLLILAFVATGVALWLLKQVLVPFVLALFFAACLKPVITFQVARLRAPQPLAVAGAVLFAILMIVIIGIPLGILINKARPVFQQRLDQFVVSAAHVLPLERFGFKSPLITPTPPPGTPTPAPSWPDQATNWLFSAIGSAVGEVTGVATGTLLVIIFTLFILLGRRGERRQSSRGMRAEIEARVQLYISQMVLLSAIAGIAVGIVLAVLGVPFAPVFGFLAFLLNFIPTIGSIVATLLPLPIILLSPEMGLTAKTLAIAIPAAMQIYLGNAVQPRVLGNALDLHPIVVLISLIFWGMIWGVAGAFLATPMTAVLRIVLEKIPATRPLAELLAGRLDAVF